MPDDAEPVITINGHLLTTAQAMTVRVAVEAWAIDLRVGLGDDEHGRKMTDTYHGCIRAIRGMIQARERMPDA